jgi:F-type H+-transporting ATPase subunit b
MPSKERDTIQNALNETFSAAVRLRFETEPNAISGIELTVGGQRLSWGIAEYLTQLEQKLGSLLETQALTPTPTPPVSLVKTPAASVA